MTCKGAVRTEQSCTLHFKLMASLEVQRTSVFFHTPPFIKILMLLVCSTAARDFPVYHTSTSCLLLASVSFSGHPAGRLRRFVGILNEARCFLLLKAKATSPWT